MYTPTPKTSELVSKVAEGLGMDVHRPVRTERLLKLFEHQRQQDGQW